VLGHRTSAERISNSGSLRVSQFGLVARKRHKRPRSLHQVDIFDDRVSQAEGPWVKSLDVVYDVA
jgi:hypothetical protein